jgi:hypothetical protein
VLLSTLLHAIVFVFICILHNLLNVLVQIANKVGLKKITGSVSCEVRTELRGGGLKRQEREAGHSSAFNSEIKKGRAIHSPISTEANLSLSNTLQKSVILIESGVKFSYNFFHSAS